MQEIYELLSRLDDKEYAIEIMKFIAINSVNRFNNKEELKSNNEEKLENNTEEVIKNKINNDELVMLFNKYGVDYNLFDDRAKDNFLKYGSLSNIESNLIAFKNNGCNICDAYAKYYGYQISEILIYSNSETINSVFNILKDTNSMVLTNKLFTYPNVFYDKEALRKIYRDKNIPVIHGNEDFIKNIKLFDSYKCDINKLMIKSFMYFTISNEVIKSGIKNLELYSVDIKKGLRNLSCFATNNQADNMDKFIELGCFDYAVNNVSRLSIPVDSLIFYKLKFIKQNGIDINEYAYGAGLSSSITYDNKEFRLGDNTIKDRESARILTRTYTMPIIKGSIYEKCEELLIKDNNNDVNSPNYDFDSSIIDMLTETSYLDKNIFELNKKIEEKFIINYEDLLKDFLSNIKDNNKYDFTLKLRNKFTPDEIYKIETLLPEERDKYLKELLTDEEYKVYEIFVISNKFNMVDFIDYLNRLIELNNPTVTVLVPNKNINYDYIDSKIKTKVSDNIYRGIKIIYKNKVYDFSLNEGNV